MAIIQEICPELYVPYAALWACGLQRTFQVRESTSNVWPPVHSLPHHTVSELVQVTNRIDDMSLPRLDYRRLQLPSWTLSLSLSQMACSEEARCHVMRTPRQPTERPTWQEAEVPTASKEVWPPTTPPVTLATDCPAPDGCNPSQQLAGYPITDPEPEPPS